MKKKYQIFVSSTFTDLRNERQAAVEGVLTAGHIPAGMELFSAGSESQLAVINRWIDESDIYMLILGGRYGSVEPNSGKSYTELEYDYAVSRKKPLFALVLHEDTLATKVKEFGAAVIETENSKSLREFRAKVLGLISEIVRDEKDIKLGVIKAIQGIESHHKLEGWIRASEVPETQPLIAEIAKHQVVESQLRSELSQAKARISEDPEIPLAPLESEFSFSYSFNSSPNGTRRAFKRQVNTTWHEIFAAICVKLMEQPAEAVINVHLAAYFMSKTNEGSGTDRKIETSALETIRIQLTALGLISADRLATTTGTFAIFWSLTSAGKSLMYQIRTVKGQG